MKTLKCLEGAGATLTVKDIRRVQKLMNRKFTTFDFVPYNTYKMIESMDVKTAGKKGGLSTLKKHGKNHDLIQCSNCLELIDVKSAIIQSKKEQIEEIKKNFCYDEDCIWTGKKIMEILKEDKI